MRSVGRGKSYEDGQKQRFHDAARLTATGLDVAVPMRGICVQNATVDTSSGVLPPQVCNGGEWRPFWAEPGSANAGGWPPLPVSMVGQ